MAYTGKRAEQGFPQHMTAKREILILENLDCLARNCVARDCAKGRAMAAGIENIHESAPRDEG